MVESAEASHGNDSGSGHSPWLYRSSLGRIFVQEIVDMNRQLTGWRDGALSSANKCIGRYAGDICFCRSGPSEPEEVFQRKQCASRFLLSLHCCQLSVRKGEAGSPASL